MPTPHKYPGNLPRTYLRLSVRRRRLSLGKDLFETTEMAKAASNARATSIGLRISASKLQAEAKNPKTKDDPRWLARHAQQFAARADAKEKALEHKLSRASKPRVRKVK
jgi:hypothetical protein